MTPLSRAAGSAAAAAATTLAVTPLAIRTARRFGFLDRPWGHKRHAEPTPYLGGTAVLAGVAAARRLDRRSPPSSPAADAASVVTAAGTGVMWVLGTLDDRVPVAWQMRAGAAAVTGVALYETGSGIRASGIRIVDETLTSVWIAGLTTAFNLMDNLDGACCSVAAAASFGVAAVALVNGDPEAAATAAGLGGASVAFLRFNLHRPRARIFLGDGGSMPVGLLVSALAARATATGPVESGAPLLAAALLCGVPILDTTLVTISRRRRGISVLTGGQDHLSHRILKLTGSPGRTAVILASLQAGLAALAVDGTQRNAAAVRRRAGWAVGGGIVVIAALELLPVARP